MSLGERLRRGKIGFHQGSWFHWSMLGVMGTLCAPQFKSNPLSSRKLTKSDWVCVYRNGAVWTRFMHQMQQKCWHEWNLNRWLCVKLLYAWNKTDLLTTRRKEVNSKLETRGRYSLCYIWLKSFKVKTIEVFSLLQWFSLYYFYFDFKSNSRCALYRL